MALLNNTYLTFDSVGQREDLKDAIYNISPTDTPFYATCAKTKATAILHEWQTDTLASAGANAALEGDDFSAAAVSPSTRLSNRCQISEKETIVSGTASAVSTAGRNREIVYQTVKIAKELKRDVEHVLTNNQAPVTGDSSTARQLRPLPSWFSTNVYAGAGGSNGSSSTARSDGSQRDLTEELLKNGFQDAWTAGGEVDMVLCGPFNKTVISGFAGNVSRIDDTSDKVLNTAIDVYVSDFGKHKVVADRFSRGRDLFGLDTNLWGCAILRPMKTMDIAKTGDADKGKVLLEFTLEARNEAGSFGIFDLNTS